MRVRVLHVPVGAAARLVEVENDFNPEIIALVGGGYIESMPVSDTLVMFCDEDGIAKHLPPSFSVDGRTVVGPAFFARRSVTDKFGGWELDSLTDEDVEELEQRIRRVTFRRMN